MPKVMAQQPTGGIGAVWPLISGTAVHLYKRSRSFESVGRCQRKSQETATQSVESGANQSEICSKSSEQSPSGWTSETSLTESSNRSNSEKVLCLKVSDFTENSQICDRLCGKDETISSESSASCCHVTPIVQTSPTIDHETTICASNDEELDIVATLASDRSLRSRSNVISFSCAPHTSGTQNSSCNFEQQQETGISPLGKKQRKCKYSTAKESWLLRLFESKLFDMSIAVQYLFNSKEPGVQSYIGNWHYWLR